MSFWCAAMCSTVISDALTSPAEIPVAGNRIASIERSVRRPLPRPRTPKRPMGPIKTRASAVDRGSGDIDPADGWFRTTVSLFTWASGSNSSDAVASTD